jgi:hypothetical protein
VARRIFILLLLFLAVPDLCSKLRRPALAYSVFVLFGFALGPLASAEVATTLHQNARTTANPPLGCYWPDCSSPIQRFRPCLGNLPAG